MPNLVINVFAKIEQAGQNINKNVQLKTISTGTEPRKK